VVVRNFIIIGKSASHLSEDFITRHAGFPWREMRDMSNIVVHEYFGVDNMIGWETLKKPSASPIFKASLAVD
jgi:uncharacterized protein with HEPN domain